LKLYHLLKLLYFCHHTTLLILRLITISPPEVTLDGVNVNLSPALKVLFIVGTSVVDEVPGEVPAVKDSVAITPPGLATVTEPSLVASIRFLMEY